MKREDKTFRAIMIALFIVDLLFIFYLMDDKYNKWIRASPYVLLIVLVVIMQLKFRKT